MDNNNIYANVNPTPVNQQTAQQTTQQPVYQQPVYSSNTPTGTRCPGKEIAGLVLGINALVWSVLGAFFSWMPFYGLIFGLIWGGFGVGFAIATNILYKKVMEQATIITNKIHTGKKLAKAGLIVGIIAMALSVVICIIWVGIIGAAALIGQGGSDLFEQLGREMMRNSQNFNF